MNREICEREQAIFAALLSGTLDPDLAAHARGCCACSDVLLVSGFLRRNSALSAKERNAMPDPGLIWRKAQWGATERAVRVASRPIRWMTILACVTFACSPWLRLLWPLAQSLTSSWSKMLDSSFVALSRTLPATSNGSLILLAGTGTMLILALSSWLILREE